MNKSESYFQIRNTYFKSSEIVTRTKTSDKMDVIKTLFKRADKEIDNYENVLRMLRLPSFRGPKATYKNIITAKEQIMESLVTLRKKKHEVTENLLQSLEKTDQTAPKDIEEISNIVRNNLKNRLDTEIKQRTERINRIENENIPMIKNKHNMLISELECNTEYDEAEKQMQILKNPEMLSTETEKIKRIFNTILHFQTVIVDIKDSILKQGSKVERIDELIEQSNQTTKISVEHISSIRSKQFLKRIVVCLFAVAFIMLFVLYSRLYVHHHLS